MTIERIKYLRKICTENYEFLDEKKLFSLVLNDRDINGGLNFEDEINYYIVGDKHWLCRHVIETTMQPEFGPTITTDRDSSTTCLTDEELWEVLNDNPTALKDFESYEHALIGKFCTAM